MISRAEQLHLLPGAGEAIARLNRSDYRAVVVTNQPSGDTFTLPQSFTYTDCPDAPTVGSNGPICAGQTLNLTPVSKDSNGYGAFIIIGHYK